MTNTNAGLDAGYLGWLAGMIDGEGSIVVSITVRTTNKGRKYINFGPVVRIVQHIRARAAMEEIRRRLGVGGVYAHTNRGRFGGETVSYQTVKRSDTRDLLNAVLPYLVIKKRQATEMLRALDILDRAGNMRMGEVHTGRRAPGEHVRTEDEARELVRIATSMNPRYDGSGNRYTGRSVESLMAHVTDIYAQPNALKSTSPLRMHLEAMGAAA